MKKTLRKILPVLALVLVVAVASVGGTIAWLTQTTDPVVNTFTVGDINITLTEAFNTDTDKDGKNDAWQAKLIPGTTYAKDPVVTVKANSEACYLFVKFEEINNPSTYLDYTSTLTVANGWTKLEDVAAVNDVWYRVVDQKNADQSWKLLVDNKVIVKNTIVKSGTTGTTAPVMPISENAPTLKYTAYAIQKEGSADAKAAWEKLNPTSGT